MLFRVATIVQMVGVVVLTFGLPVGFEAAAEGESPNNLLLVVGYLVMRVPLLALWLRAARDDPARRRTSVAYAVVIAAAQPVLAGHGAAAPAGRGHGRRPRAARRRRASRHRCSSSRASAGPRGTPGTSPSGSTC
ncbi:hypothetical protein GCM10025868_24940 [Angustibacter aerolatus]|uniref:Cation/H+ exchanger domain-containing protein n=1 Tax=Angustibacter aerolatus TaxID=1162965 RepID=A0ABQ6JJE6_9ACTN|nr:hypothetical protein GCM10025868_24940 [Angustibacter aerolatus]